MFVAHASDLIGNPVFALKMCLVMAAGVNAAAFHAGVFRGAAAWDVDVVPPAMARSAGALSLLLVAVDSLVEVMQVLRKYWFEIVEIAAE